ncbi:hypothetical protein HAALTHF_46010n [Vreelandella aquamarina]|nr:hypothetical protein HAALTHF_46010n [Halomonas axialensis]
MTLFAKNTRQQLAAANCLHLLVEAALELANMFQLALRLDVLAHDAIGTVRRPQ